jgi:hypothetical protein
MRNLSRDGRGEQQAAGPTCVLLSPLSGAFQLTSCFGQPVPARQRREQHLIKNGFLDGEDLCKLSKLMSGEHTMPTIDATSFQPWLSCLPRNVSVNHAAKATLLRFSPIHRCANPA